MLTTRERKKNEEKKVMRSIFKMLSAFVFFVSTLECHFAKYEYLPSYHVNIITNFEWPALPPSPLHHLMLWFQWLTLCVEPHNDFLDIVDILYLTKWPQHRAIKSVFTPSVLHDIHSHWIVWNRLFALVVIEAMNADELVVVLMQHKAANNLLTTLNVSRIFWHEKQKQ